MPIEELLALYNCQNRQPVMPLSAASLRRQQKRLLAEQQEAAAAAAAAETVDPEVAEPLSKQRRRSSETAEVVAKPIEPAPTEVTPNHQKKEAYDDDAKEGEPDPEDPEILLRPVEIQTTIPNPPTISASSSTVYHKHPQSSHEDPEDDEDEEDDEDDDQDDESDDDEDEEHRPPVMASPATGKASSAPDKKTTTATIKTKRPTTTTQKASKLTSNYNQSELRKLYPESFTGLTESNAAGRNVTNQRLLRSKCRDSFHHQ